jgi:cell division septation protein DedD
MMDIESEKSYLEIKVTFHHILILLAGVILIGSFLFYLGYQAGKSSSNKKDQRTMLAKNDGKTKEIEVLNKKDPDRIESVEEPSISEEIKLHQQPAAQPTGKKEREEPLVTDTKREAKPQTEPIKAAKKVNREPYFTIQVAAFNSHALAREYSQKFSKAGYPTSISQAAVKGKIWYRVWVGNYATRSDALMEKKTLEEMENKKFRIVKTE